MILQVTKTWIHLIVCKQIINIIIIIIILPPAMGK